MKTREEYQKMYTAARWALLVAVIATAVNLVWILIDKSFNFIVCLALPEVLALVEIALYSLKAPLFWQIVLVAVLVALLLLYFLIWQFAKAKPRLMTIGCVLYVIDYVFRLYLLAMDLMGGRNDLGMILIRILLPTVGLVLIVRGLSARKNLNR
jgi:hypothetical protein